MENRTERIQFRLEPSVREKAQILAKQEGRSISSYLIELIKKDWEVKNEAPH